MNFCFPKPAESWPEHFSLLAQCTTHIMPSQFVSSGAVIASCGSEKPLHGALDSRHKAPKQTRPMSRILRQPPVLLCRLR